MYWFAELVGGMIIGGIVEFVERVCVGLWRLSGRSLRWIGRLLCPRP